jgi:divalent metal cation (Fe/Co/Zn/Cd) transporter
MWYRLMDAVDPGIIEHMEHHAQEVEGVEQIASLRAHWVGHRLYGETTIVVDDSLSLIESHNIAEKVRQAMHQAAPHLEQMSIHVVPHTD